LLEEDDPERPIVMGRLLDAAAAKAPPERLEFEAGRELVLRCGRASLVLTRAGKLLLRGAYILSRSSGAVRIRGASVQIN